MSVQLPRDISAGSLDVPDEVNKPPESLEVVGANDSHSSPQSSEVVCWLWTAKREATTGVTLRVFSNIVW
jgi:hypothetical protein